MTASFSTAHGIWRSTTTAVKHRCSCRTCWAARCRASISRLARPISPFCTRPKLRWDMLIGPTLLRWLSARRDLPDKTTDILYVASTADNTIFAVPKAGKAASFVTKGTPIFAGAQLRGPLALVFAPNGNLLTANGDAVNGDPTHPSEIVEFTKSGEFVREFNIDAGQGGAFGIATVLSGSAPFNF